MARVSRRRLARLWDLAVPWGVGLFLALIALDEFDDPGSASGALALGLALAVVQGGALHWRRRRPELVMAITLVAGLGFLLLIPETVLPVAGLFAIGSVAAARPPRVSIPWLAGLLAVAASNFFTTTVEDTTFTMALAVGAWALGEASRNRQAAIDEQTRRAVADEQARIARELHDVIAHSVSVIVVQAAAADEVFDDAPRPGARRASLDRVGGPGSAPRAAPAAGRRAPGRAWRTGAAATWPERPRRPARAPARRWTGGGLAPRGPGHPLPAGVDLSAYRIVQEALTNTLRHGRATRAEVTVRYGADSLELDVRDDGHAEPDDGASRRGARPGRHARAGVAAWRHAGGGPARRGRVPRARAPAARSRAVRVRVVIADDQALVRGGFRMILGDKRRRRRRGRGGRRRRGRGARRARPARRRADGRADARARRDRGDAPDRRPRAARRGSSSSRPTTSTSTSSPPCGPEQAASCSRTCGPPSWSRRSAWWPAATRCSPPA